MDKLAHDAVLAGRIDLAREPDFKIGLLSVRPSRRVLEGAGVRCVVQRRVMQVLVALARSTNEVVSQQELISRCWGGLAVSDDAIGRCISQLRRLAGDWPEAPFAIETIAGVGYRLHVAGAGADEADQKPARPRRRSTFAAALWFAAATLLVAAGGAAWLLTPRTPQAANRVAVIPFRSPPSDGSARAFAQGLADEIVSATSSNHQQVISPTESIALEGSGRDAALRRLGVGLLVEGTVESDGPGLRTQVHVDDATQHVTLWSKTFEGPTSRPAALQAEIAARTSDVLDWALEARRTGPGLLDAQATMLLLDGSDTMANPSDSQSLDAEWESLTNDLREVTHRAPEWGIGHARLALALADDPADTSQVRSEARRALALDPHASEAYMALSEIEPPTHWSVRDDLLTRAVEADPNFSFAVLFKARLLARAGRTRDALRLAQRAVSLRPLFPGGDSTLGDLLVRSGQIPEGRRVLDNAAALWPANVRIRSQRLWVVVGLDDMDTALALIDDPQTRPTTMNDRNAAIWRIALTARRSRSTAAMRIAAREIRRAASAGVLGRTETMGLCSILADLDCAFSEAKTFPAGSEGGSLLFADVTRAMRQDRRFMSLAAQTGLVDLWRRTGRWPDFCSQRGLPYDCRTEAARLASAKAVVRS